MNEPGTAPDVRRRRIIVGALSAVIVGLIAATFFIGDRGNQSPETGSQGRADSDVPSPDLAEGRTWHATLRTTAGDVDVALDGEAAPQAVASFIHLANEGFFDGTECHRLLPSSLLQCGDPEGSGRGGPGYQFGPIENAPSDDLYPAGSVAMARVSGDGESMGSQFFLVFNDVLLPSDRAGGYTVMGTMTTGLQMLQDVGRAGTVDGSTDGRPLTSVIIESVVVQ